MLKYCFKAAYRNIKANRMFSLLNIFGLAIGLTAGVTLLLWVSKETHFDDFHKNAKRIYHLSATFTASGKQTTFRGVPAPLALISRDISGIESVIRIHEEDNQVLSDKTGNKLFGGNTIGYVDSGFLKVFDFKRLQGSPGELLPDLNDIAITKNTALKLFGSIDVLGKQIEFNKKLFIVSAVLDNFPDNSSLNFDALLPMGYYNQVFMANGGNGDWKTIDQDIGSYKYSTFVLLEENVDPHEIEQKLSAAFGKLETSVKIDFNLQQIEQMHLVSADGNASDLQMVRIMLLIGILILVIACINYINLSTARVSFRIKEVSVRKIIGAGRKHLFIQFIFETFIIFICALLISTVLLWVLRPEITQLTKTFIFSGQNNGHTWSLLSIALFTALLGASLYPALLFSSIHPITSINERRKGAGSANLIRKALVVFQFGSSFGLLVATLIMNGQMNFIRQKDPGYNKDYVFIVPLPKNSLTHTDAIKTALGNNPAIERVGLSGSSDVSDMRDNTGDIQWPGQPASTLMMIGQLAVDNAFIPAMDYKFLEGHNFKGDSSDGNKYIINEQAALDMSLQKPYVGQQIGFHKRPGEIIGVLKNFNFKPLNEKITPILLYSGQAELDNLYVRTTGRGVNEAIRAAKAVYTRYGGDHPFDYKFLDQNMESHYDQQYRTGRLFSVFSFIAISLSCLGLLGLITFAVQTRLKEIGIRKVLGASISSIISLLSKEFLILVGIGGAIFAPVTYWGLYKWLQQFQYRINLGIVPFLTALGIVLFIAAVTVSYKVYLAAVANPVSSLKKE